MLLEQENCAEIKNPTLDDLRATVERIHPRNHSFLILSNGSGYVQAAGAPLRLTVEYRNADTRQHFRLGRNPVVSETLSLNYSGGPITVNKNEVLSSDDCAVVLEEFFRNGTVPDKYNLRNLGTETFA